MQLQYQWCFSLGVKRLPHLRHIGRLSVLEKQS